MTPLTPTQHPYIRDLIISIKVFGQLVVETKKTLGWENSRKIFKIVFENLGVVSTPLNCFKNGFGQMEMIMVVKRSWWFSKRKGIGVSL
jgi:hypothetical protein